MQNQNREWTLLEEHSNRFSVTVDKTEIRIDMRLLLSMDMENSTHATILTMTDSGTLYVKFILHRNALPNSRPIVADGQCATIKSEALSGLIDKYAQQKKDRYFLQIDELTENRIICKFQTKEEIYD